MGAHQSTPEEKPKRRHHRDAEHHSNATAHVVGGDVVRGNKQEIKETDKTKEENSLIVSSDTDILGNASGTVHLVVGDDVDDGSDLENPQYDNNKPVRLVHDGMESPPELPDKCRNSKPHKTNLEHRLSQSSDTKSSHSDRGSEHDVPIIVKSTQEPKQNNMNTIKQAKVNVRDRVSMFTETNAPILPDKTKRTAAGYRKTPSDIQPTAARGDILSSSQPIPILPPKQTHNRKQSIPNDNNPLSRSAADLAIETAPELPQRPRKKADSNANAAANHKKSSTSAQFLEKTSTAEIAVPEVDYNDAEESNSRDGGYTMAGNRMNTLEYFKHVPREHTILKGFEKAKPAAMNKRGKPHRPGGGRVGDYRPHSMFPSTTDATQLYSSEGDNLSTSQYMIRDTAGGSQDLSFPVTESNHRAAQEELASTNRQGQRYAMDDTAYETLSRRKKIAGQRLAVGAVDKQTEKNFLLSLKRNLQFKHARQTGQNKDENLNRTHQQGQTNPIRLSEMVF